MSRSALVRSTVLLACAALLLAACASPQEAGPTGTDLAVDGLGVASDAEVDPEVAADTTVVVHRTEACECCGEYEDYLEGLGFTVEQAMHDDLAAIKADFGVPDDQRSCHTNEVAGYAVEGHVPAAALLDLVAASPDADGISLAGMPSGSPGMPGEQEAPFEVLTFQDGRAIELFGEY